MNPSVILPMRRSDVARVASIARVSFAVPWDATAFARELSQPYAVLRVLRPGHGQPICAFVHLWRIGEEAQIINVATLPDHRRRGYGLSLMEDALSRARVGRCGYVTLEVRRSNQAAIQLYRRLGFQEMGVRQRYYSDDQEDALLLRLDL